MSGSIALREEFANGVGAPRVVSRLAGTSARVPQKWREPMSMVALELERQARADRLVQEIAARHGLPAQNVDQTTDPDRFLVAYVPDVGGTAGTPHAVEYAFASSMLSSIDLLKRVAADTSGNAGTAAYVHDLDGGME